MGAQAGLAPDQGVLDTAGAAARCSTVDSNGYLVLARQDAIYFFSPDGRGPCFVSEGALHAPGSMSMPYTI